MKLYQTDQRVDKFTIRNISDPGNLRRCMPNVCVCADSEHVLPSFSRTDLHNYPKRITQNIRDFSSMTMHVTKMKLQYCFEKI